MPKRLGDVCGACIGLLLCLPLFLTVLLIVWLFSGQPIFFRGQRVGRFGEPFFMLKFRSMILDAEANGSGVIHWQDRRITRLGRLLRATKLDELPQLYNVLKGDMSLVGPRPELWRYAETFRGEARQILKIRPGLTDWATLVTFDGFSLCTSVANIDREYMENIRPLKTALQLKYLQDMNFRTDVRILFHTMIKLVVRRWLPSELRRYRNELKGSHANASR